MTPIPARQIRVQLISTVTNAGSMRFRRSKEPVRASSLIQCFKRLIVGSDGKLFIILYSSKIKCGGPCREWV